MKDDDLKREACSQDKRRIRGKLRKKEAEFNRGQYQKRSHPK
jgi:hypothetical protein